MADDTHNSCNFDGDLLAYLYNEMSDSERNGFESHLEACETCVGDLAILSESHYSMYEWKTVEFALMETPRIVIPFGQKSNQISWVDSLKAAFAFPKGFAIAGAGLAGFVVVALGFVFIGSSNTTNIARNSIDRLPSESVVNQMETPLPKASVDERRASIDPPAMTVTPKAKDKPEIINAGFTSSKKTNVTRAQADKIRNTKSNDRTAPRLTTFDDSDDNSLRLAELFNDIDTRDLDELE